jgi:hypothetical protein
MHATIDRHPLRAMEASMSIEDVWYESSPYLYLLAGLAALAWSEGTMATVSALLLLLAAATILRLRWVHRRGQAAARAQANRSIPSKARRQSKAASARQQPAVRSTIGR